MLAWLAERWVRRGWTRYAGADPAAAERLARRALRAKRGHAGALFLLGESARMQGRTPEAIEWLRAALAQEPRLAGAHLSLGRALWTQQEYAPAAAAARAALTLDARMVDAQVLLGASLEFLDDEPGAAAAYEAALAVAPQSVNARWNRALLYLSRGDYARGWPELEWRWQKPEMQTLRRMAPREWWDGAGIEDRTILLFAEQGFGDAIQFIRYAPLVAARGARVVLDCHPPLRELLRRVPGVSEVLSSDAEMAHHDLAVPLLSLPGLFATRPDCVPAPIPYVTASAEHAREWRERIRPAAGALRVGVVWASNPSAGYAARKSVPFEIFSRLAAVPGVTFYSLQTGMPAVPAPGASWLDVSAGLRDFSHTAGALANLDLVISVDTAVAHLAGAMAKEVWTLLPRRADWRWQLDAARSPWYPTMRLLRQQRAGDWNAVIDEAATLLRARSAAAHPA